ncbi:alpha/beta fold hydrolase [Nakamurella sp.]|uniref:alpha/beta fold hydrolase n=1 Tax=Nakamurella sp. TaxID=1869182 RepID=UPI003783CA8E
MSPHRISIHDTAARPPVPTTRQNGPRSERATTPPTTSGPTDPAHARHARRPMRVVVALSLFVGLAAAAVGVVGSAGGTEPVVDGVVLLGFSAGWALLLVLSVFFTDHPQRWAAVPAAALGLSGAALLLFTPSSATLDALGWVWPAALVGLLGWITIRIRRELPHRGGRWMLYPVIAVTALAAVGGGFHTVRQSVDQASAQSRPGQLIDVGDHGLFLSCTGSGEPTVILEPGLGGTSAAWGWIAPTVAAHTRVCAYDRAGRGRSEPSPEPQNGDRIATDLHILLERAGVTGPLVMVGHSLGGLYVLDYAARHPQQVAGLVLVDATPSTAFTSLPDYPAIFDMLTTMTGWLPGLARLGVTQLVNGVSDAELPAPARDQVRADSSTAGQARSERDELTIVPTMMARAGAVTDLGDLPLSVLTASVDTQTGWLAAQMGLAALSDNSVHQVVAGADHQSLLDNQSDAAMVSQAIAKVVDAARTGTPLG